MTRHVRRALHALRAAAFKALSRGKPGGAAEYQCFIDNVSGAYQVRIVAEFFFEERPEPDDS
ncbi:MAG: hypothetical protein ABII12_02065 [Planctomycetota bacterium]